MLNRDIGLLINTPLGKHSQVDDYTLRQAAIVNRVSYTTTMSAAAAAGDAILALRSRKPTVRSLQEWQAAHEKIFKAMDPDHDGTVSFEEMMNFFRGRTRAPVGQTRPQQ